MNIPQHPQSTAVLNRMQQLLQQTAATQWRGLLVIQATPRVQFSWPASALVLEGALADYREHLGTSQALLVLDMRVNLHGDALAAMLPTVEGKGLAVLILPFVESPFSDRLLNNLPPLFAEYLQLESTHDDVTMQVDLSSFKVLDDAPERTPHSLQTASVSSLTSEQSGLFHRLIEHIEQRVPCPALINAPRGRGKSTLLGVLAKQLSGQGEPVWLCAPSRRQAATLLGAAGVSLQAAQATGQIHFIAPDALLADECPVIAGHILLDEAASLPRHMLDTLIQRYPKVIMATTSEGYEACGRGFLLQFQAQLSAKFNQFLSLRLEEPIRFAANCPVETWLNRTLLLNLSESSIESAHRSADSAPVHMSYTKVHASTLSESALATCFHLLMDAHYQTSPNDLKLLLNDPSQTLCLQKAKFANRAELVVVGVVWLSEEGRLNQDLATAVMVGTRRPPGNLLAQSLVRHLQSPTPARALWLRVVRIAIRNEHQQQGFGSALLQHVIKHSMESSDLAPIAGIGTSFASATQINRFWCRHGFMPVRMGSRKDSATARRALLMLYPLDTAWIDPVVSWANYFAQELSACQHLYQLSDNYVASLQSAQQSLLSASPDCSDSSYNQLSYKAWAERRIHAFANDELDLDSIRPTLLTRFPRQVEANPILKVAVHSATLSRADKRRLGLSGRKELINQARRVCLQLLAQL